jgi:hypothetical protein
MDFKFESTIKGMQQRMEDLVKEMARQNDEKLMKQKLEMEVGIWQLAFGR